MGSCSASSDDRALEGPVVGPGTLPYGSTDILLQNPAPLAESWPATAVAGKQVAHRGDTLVASRGSEVRFEGTVSGMTGGEIQVILDGRVPLPKDPHIRSASASFEFPWRSDGKRHWIRVDVRDGASRSSELTQCCFLP